MIYIKDPEDVIYPEAIAKERGIRVYNRFEAEQVDQIPEGATLGVQTGQYCYTHQGKKLRVTKNIPRKAKK